MKEMDSIMTKINWKVRLKNPVFWATFGPAAVSLIYLVLGLLDVVPTVSESSVIQIVATLIDALTTLGILVDPTTSGLQDSEQAMTYSVPRSNAG